MTDTTTVTFDENAIDAIFADLDQGQLPGAAVGIAVDGIPVYRKGFGLANMELPTPLAPTMRMRIGSTTKHFAALAFLLLCEEGRAGLDEPIGRYIPKIHPASRDATMRQLMGHVSGLRDAMTLSLTVNGASASVSDRDLLALYETIDDLEFEPETRWCYNNGAYALLTAAIEQIAGEPLEEVLRHRVFEPVGMSDTMLRRRDSDFVPNSATLHFRRADGTFTRDYMGAELSGAGGIVSSMDDMLRWLRHMDAPTVGSAQTWQTLREPLRLKDGTCTGYAMGLIVGEYRGVGTLSHGGGVVAGNSQMLKVPSAGLDISIAVNRADVSGADLANRVIDACLSGLAPRVAAPIAPRDATFVSRRDGRVVELIKHGNAQLLAIDGGPPLPVTADAEGILHLPDILSFVCQTAKDEGDHLLFRDFGDEDSLDVIETTSRDGPPPVGRWRVAGIGATAECTMVDGSPSLTLRGTCGAVIYGLQPLGASVWRATPGGPFAMFTGTITFDDGDETLYLSVGRMLRLRFAREA